MAEEKLLARSPHYRLVAVDEDAVLVDELTGERRGFGDHYGEPSCGLISPGEDWFVAGGEGLTWFDFERGLRRLLRSPDRGGEGSTLYVHAIKLERDGTIKILIDPWREEASVWRLDPRILQLTKLNDGPDLREEEWRQEVEF